MIFSTVCVRVLSGLHTSGSLLGEVKQEGRILIDTTALAYHYLSKGSPEGVRGVRGALGAGWRFKGHNRPN
jgi:hypothetical protein